MHPHDDIDIAPLERAIARLEEALAAYQIDTSRSIIRDGLVQRFESPMKAATGF